MMQAVNRMPRRICTALRKDGSHCKGPAVRGADKCRMHLGKKPGGSILQAQAERLLHRFDAPAVADPLEALQRLAGRALALEETIGRLVNDLTVIRYESEGGGEQLRAEVAVLERAMDRCGKLLVDIAKLNIEERIAKVTEWQAEQVYAALSVVFGEMGLSAEQQREGRAGIARHLRAV